MIEEASALKIQSVFCAYLVCNTSNDKGNVLFGVGLPLQSPILQIDREYRKDDSSVHGLSETIVGWNRVEPDPRM